MCRQWVLGCWHILRGTGIFRLNSQGFVTGQGLTQPRRISSELLPSPHLRPSARLVVLATVAVTPLATLTACLMSRHTCDCRRHPTCDPQHRQQITKTQVLTTLEPQLSAMLSAIVGQGSDGSLHRVLHTHAHRTVYGSQSVSCR